MLLWHRQAAVFEREHVALDGLANVGDGRLAALTLRNAPLKTGALGDPRAIFARIDDDLSYSQRLRRLNAEARTPCRLHELPGKGPTPQRTPFPIPSPYRTSAARSVST